MSTQAARQIGLSKKTISWESFKRKYLKLKVNSFRPKITFSFDFKGFTIKTVDSRVELWEVLRLRHDIFTKAYGVKMKSQEVDFDKLDLLGDHVVLVCHKTQRIIGTYRLICSSFSNEFYSDSEFDISKFKSAPGVKLELGRACIHEDYRNGASISLVWRGMSKYIVACGADYLFGCTSVLTTNAEVAKRVLAYCQREYQTNKYEIQPTKKYSFPMYEKLQLVDRQFDVEKYIPSLMKSYLSAGAVVYGRPALDKVFACTDFFTVLDLENITPAYYKRYIKPWRETLLLGNT